MSITSFADFERGFGALGYDCPMTYAVRDFFLNGGTHAVIVKIEQFTDGGGNGMDALDAADIFNLLCIPPDSSGADVFGVVYPQALAYCKDRRAMLIADPPPDWDSFNAAVAGAQAPNLTVNGENGAMYFPSLVEADPLREFQTFIYPASGAVAGIIARIDAQRGVWHAPAGAAANVIGIQDLSVPLTDAEDRALAALGVNCLRTFAGVGSVVWGSRTLRGADALGDEYKYVPVRRLALYLEDSIDRGTQWAAFEPNDEPLWAQIRESVEGFMHDLLRAGAFAGKTPKDAYFVRCDPETTTPDDQANGIVNIVVGFAPLLPAEFVVIRIQQSAAPKP